MTFPQISSSMHWPALFPQSKNYYGGHAHKGVAPGGPHELGLGFKIDFTWFHQFCRSFAIYVELKLFQTVIYHLDYYLGLFTEIP